MYLLISALNHDKKRRLPSRLFYWELESVKSDLAKNQNENEIGKMFDLIAPKYDFLNGLLSLKQDKRWRRKLISMVPQKTGGHFLDVATGTGDVVLLAANSRKEYSSYTGVDISKEMMSLAAEKSVTKGLHNAISFKTMSGEDLKLESGKYDCITIAFGLRNIVDKKKALMEFHRVLAPGGALLILEFFTPENALLGRAYNGYFHKILPLIGGFFSSRKAYTYLPESVETFYSREALNQALTSVGFSVKKQINFLFGATRIVEAKK